MDAAAAWVGTRHRGRDGGCAAGRGRAAAGRAPACTSRGGRAAGAWRPEAAPRTAEARSLRPPAPSARCRPTGTTTVAVASVRSAYLQKQQQNIINMFFNYL